MKAIAIDQGTTGTKAFTLDEDGHFETAASFEHRQIYPQPGWVEHDAEELLSHVSACLAAAPDATVVGIDNQGETVIAWDSATGQPLCNAIVWQDARTASVIDRLKADGAESLTQERAGLPLDPYFSAAKLRWVIDHVDGAAALLSAGRLRLGTSDAFFNGRLTGVYATDVTTASRTSLMNLASLEWDDDLCALFGVPRECLPEIRATTGPFGEISGRPLTASLVDQQAALFGHGCEKPGDAKITFGTGAFALAVAGPKRPPPNDAGLVATVAWQQGSHPVEFALDGGVYNAASAVNWARGLGLFKEFGEINGFTGDPAIARGLAFVPALSGLACPHWDRSAAGLWIGLGLETSAADMMQSLLEGVAFRAAEVMAALDGQTRLSARISIDGGLARNPYFVTFLANVLNRTVVVAGTPDLTGLGTARMALRGAGLQTLPPLPQPLTEVAPLSPLSADHHLRFKRARERAGGWKDA